jgi:hypothetical protein
MMMTEKSTLSISTVSFHSLFVPCLPIGDVFYSLEVCVLKEIKKQTFSSQYEPVQTVKGHWLKLQRKTAKGRVGETGTSKGDHRKLYSGNSTTSDTQPQLIIEYYDL